VCLRAPDALTDPSPARPRPRPCSCPCPCLQLFVQFCANQPEVRECIREGSPVC